LAGDGGGIPCPKNGYFPGCSGGGGDDDDDDGGGGGVKKPDDLLKTLTDDYKLGWTNFGTAWSIMQNAPVGSDGWNYAAAYITAWGGAHLMFGLGVGMLAYAAYTAVLTAGTTTSGCAATDCTRVFWAGGEKAMQAAQSFANSVNGITLEMSRIGQALTPIHEALDSVLGKGAAYQIMKPLWNAASYHFAQGASGTVNVFMNAAAYNPNGAWAIIELPALQANSIPIIVNFVH
jgi:hypothetical protein